MKCCPICCGELQEYVTDEGIVTQCLLHGIMKPYVELPPQNQIRSLKDVDAFFQKADETLKEILIVTRGVIGKDALLSCGKVETGKVKRKCRKENA
jgi:hypothetical protein